ncbi:right-handed parallel beta-helix repeat-containing protein [Asanoa siamensis]|uniref:Right handed beta helix region n=1 Tax=Asanoa siamensis TaxID=926357 RepID=A0ABQ4CSN9_9ACTN|nr:right-handed parallel beta-helix repeat-containing protein [Asanoa siamensis]GIF74292.1 hypothetical protein Asi02nite_38100 [Asanoa siamensis]
MAPGFYPETVVVPSGEPGRPITLRGGQSPGSRRAELQGTRTSPAFRVSGVHDVVIDRFDVGPGLGPAPFQPGVLVENSSDITITNGWIDEVQAPAIAIKGDSHRVTVSGMSASSYRSPVFSVGAGATDTLLANNSTHSRRTAADPNFAAIAVADAPRTIVTNNTVVTDCHDGVAVTGASPGFALHNSVVRTTEVGGPGRCAEPGIDPAGSTPVTVAGAAATDGRVDYNALDPGHRGPLYRWAGASYATPGALRAATGQAAHDLGTDPKIADADPGDVGWSLLADSPGIDSALAAAPGVQATDLRGNPHADKPDTANSGGGYVDRGAVELVPTPNLSIAVAHAPGGGALETLSTTTRTSPWATDGPIGTLEFTGDGEDPVLDRTGSARTTFDFAGNVCVHVRLSLDGFRSNVLRGLASECIMLTAAYNPVTPRRVLDTRSGFGVVPAAGPVPIGPDAAVDFYVNNPLWTASAVVLNVTATQPTTSGFLKVYEHLDAEPDASNVNFAAGQTIANLVTVRVQEKTARIRIRNGGRGTVHVLADLAGYYANTGNGFAAGAPARVLDTRSAVGVPGTAPIAANGKVTVDLSTRVPAGTTAAALNLTVTGPTKGGLFTAFAPGQAVPTASNLNFVAGQTVNNMVIAPVVDGKVAFAHTGSGTVHLIADLAGWFPPGARDLYLPWMPTRIADTRGTPVGPGQTVRVSISRSACPVRGCPPPSAVVANLTVTNAQRSGYLSVYPYGGPRPTQSVLNFGAGQTVATLVTVGLGEDSFLVYNGGKGPVDVLVDQAGFYVGPES